MLYVARSIFDAGEKAAIFILVINTCLFIPAFVKLSMLFWVCQCCAVGYSTRNALETAWCIMVA